MFDFEKELDKLFELKDRAKRLKDKAEGLAINSTWPRATNKEKRAAEKAVVDFETAKKEFIEQAKGNNNVIE